MLLISEAAIVAGTFKYTLYYPGKTYVLGLAHLFVFVILILFIEGIHQKFKKGEVDFNHTDEIISRDDFDARIDEGEELVILDDLVLNISKFKTEHPGGRFLLEHNIGRDISKFFYGGYTLEQGVGLKPVQHSNVARTIVNHIIVGRLIERATTFSVRITATQVINHQTKTSILRAEGKEPGWAAPASTDLSSFGRHYLLRSYHNPEVRRHYSAAACMKTDAYQQYVGLINQYKEGDTLTFDEKVLPENQEEAEVVFVSKNYKQRGGLSQRIHETPNDLCQIKAQLGKGLGLKNEGTHIAFVAGTGVLVFVDLIALMLR